MKAYRLKSFVLVAYPYPKIYLIIKNKMNKIIGKQDPGTLKQALSFIIFKGVLDVIQIPNPDPKIMADR